MALYRRPQWHNVGELNERTHRKFLSVDGKVGFTGGFGIAGKWRRDGEDPAHWRDSHFRPSLRLQRHLRSRGGPAHAEQPTLRGIVVFARQDHSERGALTSGGRKLQTPFEQLAKPFHNREADAFAVR